MKAVYTLCFLVSVSSALAQEPAKTNSPATKPAVAQSDTKPSGKVDRLDLDTTVVTGNRELPKVLYIVPWKKAELGELPAQPFNTLLDEVLAPVDRDVFKREVKYFDTVAEQAAAKSQSIAPTPDPGAR
jgi:hypothetical protein